MHSLLPGSCSSQASRRFRGLTLDHLKTSPASSAAMGMARGLQAQHMTMVWYLRLRMHIASLQHAHSWPARCMVHATESGIHLVLKCCCALADMHGCLPSVLGDAIHFVLCGLRKCKFTDIACQDMQLRGSNKLAPASTVTVTLEFELQPAASGESPCSASFTRTCTSASSRSRLTFRNAGGESQQLTEVGERIPSMAVQAVTPFVIANMQLR